MSFVTLGDKTKALQMVSGRSTTRDRLLLSLAGQTTWTAAQRELVEQMWNERQQRKKEASMKLSTQHSTLSTTGALLLALCLATATGCAATYEKRFTDHDGKPVVILEQHEPDWWNNLGTPDWMNVRHETITRDGKVIADRRCTHEPTTPTILSCETARE